MFGIDGETELAEGPLSARHTAKRLPPESEPGGESKERRRRQQGQEQQVNAQSGRQGRGSDQQRRVVDRRADRSAAVL